MPTINTLALLVLGQEIGAILATAPGLSANLKSTSCPFSLWAHWRRIADALASDAIDIAPHKAMTRSLYEIQCVSIANQKVARTFCGAFAERLRDTIGTFAVHTVGYASWTHLSQLNPLRDSVTYRHPKIAKLFSSNVPLSHSYRSAHVPQTLADIPFRPLS